MNFFMVENATLSFMRPFGCLVTILNKIDHLGKFDGKADEGFFVGYSLNSKAFRLFNSRTRIVEENLHIRFSKSTPNVAGTRSNGFVGTKASDNAGQARKETKPVKDYILLPLWTADPPYSQDPKSSHDDESKPSNDDGKKVDEDPRKDSECNDQEKEDNVNITNTVNAAGTNKVNDVSGETSIELPFDLNMPALEDVRIFDFSRDDENDGAEDDMNNLDTTIHVSPIPTIRIHKDHPLNQVIGDLQSATQTRKMSKNLEEHGTQKDNSCSEGSKLNRGYAGRASTIQATRNLDFLDRVYKVEKALYRLHQAPRAWYETLSTYLLDNGFQRGKIDKTLFIKRHKGDILLVQVYVDDIIFGSTKKELCNAFEKLMHEKFQMSSMGELTLFLGLQVQQKKDGIFISQDKYVVEILKKFGFTEVKTATTPMETQKPLLKDEDGKEVDVHMYRSMIGSLMYLTSSRLDIMFAVCVYARYQVNPKVSHLYAVKKIFRYIKGQPKLGLWYLKDSIFNLVAYTDSDYARASLDKKSTTGGFQFLGCRLISWQCKKQTVVANSTIEAEYVVVSSCCGQVLWIQNQLLDYGKPKRKDTQVPQPINLIESVADEAVHKESGDNLVRATTTASSLEAKQDNGNIDKTQSKATPNESSLLITTSDGSPRCQETIGDTIAQTRFENVSKHSNDSLLARGNTLQSDEDRLKLDELMALCTTLQNMVLDLEKTKTTQDNEIASLKRRVKKLEKKNRSRTHKLKRLYKVGLTARVESFNDEESLGDDASKQGRIDAIDTDEEITLVSVHDMNVSAGEEVAKEVVEVINTAKLIIDVAQVSVASDIVSAASAATIVSAATTTTTTITTDKGKGILIELVKPIKKKDQILLDEETALNLQAEFDEEERLAREKSEKEKEVNIALIETWDDIQAKIDDDHQLAKIMQAQEQEELSIEEKGTLFQQLLEKRRKYFATKRAKEKRNKPPKAQQRKIMCTYLKNMEGYKLKDLKLKEFDSIQEMFDRAFKRVNTFEDFRTELVEDKEKRAGTELVQESTKKQKVEDDKETAELKQRMEIIPDEKEVVIDAIPLAVKTPKKKYPLTPSTLIMMLEKKLMIGYESKMAYQLLKFIMKQLKKYAVPTGKDNFIVSAGRPNMVSAGRIIVSPGSITLGPGL
ncbi:uncharacterized mitochondrial protein-like protein [Tanacetum coccineum]